MGFRGSEVQILSPRPISLQHLERISLWLGRSIAFDGRVFGVFWVGCQDMNRAAFHKTGREERLKTLETIKTVLQREPSIVFAFLHGSFLFEPSFRDIDVGVFLGAENALPHLDLELDLSQRLEDALDSKFPVEVKIVNQAPLSFRFSVIKGKLLFARNDDILVDFMTTTARQYLDFAPLRQRYIKEAMAS
jgi:predicted nucleotidyltransferase